MRRFLGVRNLVKLSVPSRNFFTVVNQYERGLRFTLGKMRQKELDPGLWFYFPYIQKVNKVDQRTRIVELSKQTMITRDNVKIDVDAVVQFRINDISRYIINLSDHFSHRHKAIAKRSEVELREAVASNTIDELLSKKDHINSELTTSMQQSVVNWGIEIDAIKINNIEFDESMVRAMGCKAEAQRRAEAKVISAQADVEVSQLYNKASKEIDNEVAIKLRQMELLSKIAAEKGNNFIIYPSEALDHKIRYQSHSKAV